MSPQKALSDELARSHGKSSMSEVLRIERQRFMEQAVEEMRAQLAPPDLAPPPCKQPERTLQEGVSRFSRFVGQDLSEFAGIVVQTRQTVMAAQDRPIDSYYSDVSGTLPFSSQRQLLLAICRLTVGCESFSCHVTLNVLSSAAGIRNVKTLRKWLANLQQRCYIRYIPMHGDLRGSVIEITPPKEVRASIERNWRNTRRKD